MQCIKSNEQIAKFPNEEFHHKEGFVRTKIVCYTTGDLVQTRTPTNKHNKDITSDGCN